MQSGNTVNNEPAFLEHMRNYVAHCTQTDSITSDTDSKSYVDTKLELFFAFFNPLLQEIEEADLEKVTGLVQVCAEANEDGKNAFHWLADAINRSALKEISPEHLSNFTKPFINLIKKADANTLAMLVQACTKSAEKGHGQGTNVFYLLFAAIFNGALNKLSPPQLIILTQPLTNLIKKADTNTLASMIQGCATPAEMSNDQGKNAFYWLAAAINTGVKNKLSLEQLIALTQLFVRMIEKTDANKLAPLVQAWAKPAEAGLHQNKNVFYWLATAIRNGALDELSPEHLITLIQPFVSLIEKSDASTFAMLIKACAIPAEKDDDQGKNAFYWLAAAIYSGANNNLSPEQVIILTQPFVDLIENADASTIAELFQACAKPAEASKDQGMNAFNWLVSAINTGISYQLPPEELLNISRPLLLLLEKLTTPEQVRQVTDAIEKDGAMRAVRDQLKIYLVQKREHEDVAAKLTRLKNYLDPSKPFYEFISKNTSSIFVRSETALVQEIHAEIDKLEQTSSNTNFPWEKAYSKDDEKQHGMWL